MYEPKDDKWAKLDWLKANSPLPATRLPQAKNSPEVDRRLKFRYRPNASKLLLCAIFFGLCGLLMAHTAQTNDRGLIIEHLIPLSVGAATMFYWIIAAIGFGFVILAIAQTPQLFIDRSIVLDDTSITVPAGPFSNRKRQIPLEKITDLKVTSYKKYTFVKVCHADGTFTVNSSMLPGNDDAMTIFDGLQRRMERLKSGRQDGRIA